MLDQDNNFYLISLNILITCLLDNVWAAPDTSIKEKRLNYIFLLQSAVIKPSSNS